MGELRENLSWLCASPTFSSGRSRNPGPAAFHWSSGPTWPAAWEGLVRMWGAVPWLGWPGPGNRTNLVRGPVTGHNGPRRESAAISRLLCGVGEMPSAIGSRILIVSVKAAGRLGARAIRADHPCQNGSPRCRPVRPFRYLYKPVSGEHEGAIACIRPPCDWMVGSDSRDESSASGRPQASWDTAGDTMSAGSWR